MKKYNIYTYKNDLNYASTGQKYIYKTIYFNNLNEKNLIKVKIIKTLSFFFKKMSVTKDYHIFIVGLGNDNYTSDSIGPKALKHIKVNSFLENLNIEIKGNKIYALEPGVMGETGIMTEKIIYSISKEINPDLIILIDSFVGNNINSLNKTIQINNRGLNPGSGIKGINSVIDMETFNIPVIVIGVITAIEIKFTNKKNINYTPYLLSTKDVDEYVNIISEIIGESINEAINDL